MATVMKWLWLAFGPDNRPDMIKGLHLWLKGGRNGFWVASNGERRWMVGKNVLYPIIPGTKKTQIDTKAAVAIQTHSRFQ